MNVSKEELLHIAKLANLNLKDEVVDFEDKEALLSNAPEQERNMFKIPKVIQ